MIHKSVTKTGVADYFAVLGIDSFSSGGKDSSRESHVKEEDVPSIDLDTPKSDNLSSIPSRPCVRHDNERDDRCGGDSTEERMHLERFHREIVHLALVSSSESFDNKQWKVCDSNNAVSNESDSSVNSNGLKIYGAPLHISGKECDSVQLAYQHRGQHADGQKNNSTIDEDSLSGQESYSIPAVADVSIHYVKVHPLSIPNSTPVPSDRVQISQQQKQQPKQDQVNPIVAVAQATKTLSSLARRTTGLGKEIATEGLISVVKGVRGVTLGSGETNNIENDVSKTEACIEEDKISEKKLIAQNNSFEDAHRDLPRWKENPTEHGRKREHFFPDTPGPAAKSNHVNTSADAPSNGMLHKSLSEMLPLPPGCNEWVIPSFCQIVYLPTSRQLKRLRQQSLLDSSHQLSSSGYPILLDRTEGITSPTSMGVEALYISPLTTPTASKTETGPDTLSRPNGDIKSNSGAMNFAPDPAVIPLLTSWKAVPTPWTESDTNSEHVYIPILAVRRQRVGEEERYHEDPAVIDIQLSFLDSNGTLPSILEGDDDDDDDDAKTATHYGSIIMKQSPWTSCLNHTPKHRKSHPVLLVRRNIPSGFADIPFPAKVMDRFPQKNYRDMPFPEEELPMFCYASGSRLVRDKLKNLPMPKSFGFVVKNERGDSIYVSCLSFLEPLTIKRQKELDMLSSSRRKTSLPHKYYTETMESKRHKNIFDRCHMVAFDDQVTFESKTIGLVGRYPFWTAFRQFLTHLQLLSGLSSDTPIERHISHLLLSVPIPKPGGQCILIPMSTMREPMALLMPPLKDLPLLDLSYTMLFSALDVPTVATIVLGFLCLEKKVILISTRQCLVLDCCELLKSLLFPFDLCAPYVPHLTSPFMSVLEFPGAIFVGIHDDADGLASTVRESIPEDSIVVELDSGEIKCDGNRYATLKAAYQIIPSDSRATLIKEVESLCHDAGIVPGQEPLDYSIDSTIDSTVPFNLAESFGNRSKKVDNEPLDDRGIRDCFLRFFCSILGGYERFLVVPDADFLISGNDWFDSSKFLATAPPSRHPFLSSLLSTQLFQSFIQRRTEASDVHCVLFDECLVEYHSSKTPYGVRGDGDLLVDQCATEPDFLLNEDDSSFIAKAEVIDEKSSSQFDSDTATHASLDSNFEYALNSSGDIVTVPSVEGLPLNSRFAYCIDGQPSFPVRFHRSRFIPTEPEYLTADSNDSLAPILTRSDREKEEATRLLNSTVTKRGPQKQHRCLWQLPKFMGSQFLGTWLMCIPTQLSQPNLSLNDKTKIILRALGALRTLRSHRRIVADEAAFRALIVACGKCGTDRRVELMKLYGLMRTDSIFPNAVTLGQYTRAIAEGYSRRSEDTQGKVGMQISMNAAGSRAPMNLDALDSNLQVLEESGQKWRSQGNSSKAETLPTGVDGRNSSLEMGAKPVISPAKTFDTATTAQRQSKNKRSWLPVTCSSSFASLSNDQPDRNKCVNLVALWTRAVSCESCHYIPFDEEIHCGWDTIHSMEERNPNIACPRCGTAIVPLIGFKNIAFSEALEATELHSFDNDLNSSRDSTSTDLPPQLEGRIYERQPPNNLSIDLKADEGFVSYFSPYKLRLVLEQLIEEYGEEVLRRDRLLKADPQVFYNLWWYCARFSLPLPLTIASQEEETNCGSSYCAFASWDKTVAMQGCHSGARAIAAAQSLRRTSDRSLREKLFDNPSTDMPILSFFNFQNYAQTDWDHEDLSEILVALVKACETRDLLPVVECVFQRNLIRNQKQNARANSGSSFLNSSFESVGLAPFSLGESSGAQLASSELDCYRTMLYLARYQCMTAFHAFFPTSTKGCKGYHFWCPSVPWSIFDRAFREAAQEYGKRNKLMVPIPDVSDVAIGFRCIFGHII